MANIIRTRSAEEEYPSSDGLPMAETDVHRDNMFDLIESLKILYADKPDVYVSGNMLMYYQRGDKRKHVSPDVFVVNDIAKHQRDNYLVWVEGKGPDLVIELTSPSTAKEDQGQKLKIYRDILKVNEYFLFDPKNEYLKPSLQGYRLSRGRYVRIRPVQGRLPSRVLELYLERDGHKLRLFDPASQRWILTPAEKSSEAEQKAQEAVQKAQEAVQKTHEAEQKVQEAVQKAHEAEQRLLALQSKYDCSEKARLQTEAELRKLNQEIELLRQRQEES